MESLKNNPVNLVLRQHFGCFVQSGRSRHSRLFPEYRASATLCPPLFRWVSTRNVNKRWLTRPGIDLILMSRDPFSSASQRKSVSSVLTSAPITREESPLSPNQTFVSPFPPPPPPSVRLSHCVSLFVSSPSVPPSVSLFGGRAYWRPGGEES